jgi:octaprenyl-diphosphate synthase
MQSPVHIDMLGNIQQSAVPAFELIKDELVKVKQLINEELTAYQLSGQDSWVPNQKNIILSAVQLVRGGKMIRPAFVLLAGSAVGKITEEHIRAAAVFEIIHNATLLHDDVIDDGQKRRGQPTINSLWGNESAVLLGDFLLSRVFKMCTKLKQRVAKEIADATARVCEGELRQVSERQNWQLSETQYLDIITEKSASVFSSCCFLGGFLAKGTETQLRTLRRFGLNAGIAFQITDDLLDIIGNENETGKTLRSDAVKNKLTLAVIHLLTAADESEKDIIKTKLITTGESKVDLAKMLKSFGSLEYAYGRAQEFAAQAVAALADLKDSDAKNALIETAKFMANRAV